VHGELRLRALSAGAESLSHGDQLDPPELEPAKRSRLLYGVSPDTIGGLTDDRIEWLGPLLRGREQGLVSAARSRGAGNGRILVRRDDGDPVLGRVALAERDLILAASRILKLGRKPRVDGCSLHRLPLVVSWINSRARSLPR
jgi:hypothetical protein